MEHLLRKSNCSIFHNMIFFLFDLILYVPVNNLSNMSGPVFFGLTSTKQGLMCLAQGHNAVMLVRLEPAPFGLKLSFCLFDFTLYIPSTIFQLNREGSSWV